MHPAVTIQNEDFAKHTLSTYCRICITKMEERRTEGVSRRINSQFTMSTVDVGKRRIVELEAFGEDDV